MLHTEYINRNTSITVPVYRTKVGWLEQHRQQSDFLKKMKAEIP